MKREYVDQGTLAAILQVDRGAILAFQKRGMPYKAGEAGERNRYDIGLAVYWVTGNKMAKDHQIRLTALEKILLSFAYGSGHRTFAAWELRALSFGEWLQATEKEIATAAGFLHGSNLLPWKRT